jgi:hypothetical protein
MAAVELPCHLFETKSHSPVNSGVQNVRVRFRSSVMSDNFRRDDKLFSFALYVSVKNQAFDNLGAWLAFLGHARSSLAQPLHLQRACQRPSSPKQRRSVKTCGGFVCFPLTSIASTSPVR